MTGPDDEHFRIRPSPPRARGGDRRGAKRFVSQVLRASQTSSGGAGRPLAVRRSRGAEKGRGYVAARLVGSRLGPRSRRVVIKARLVVFAKAAPGSATAHLRYIQRDSVTREGERGRAYSTAQDVADADGFEARGHGDRHQFRFIVSPEDAAELHDLKGFTRDLMARMEADLGTRLDWIAVDHHDTDNPHTHVVLRGVDEQGGDLVIARDYISHGLRLRACELATDLLGPQTELEMRARMTAEVAQERWIGLDRKLAELVRADGRVVLEPVAGGADERFRRGLLVGRLQALETLGLAGKESGDAWVISPKAEQALRTMGERGDIVRTMQRALGGAERPLDIHTDPSSSAAPVIGRVAGKGLADELQDRGYLVVDGIDGRAHYVELPAGAGLADYPKGAIVEVRAAANEPRPADRAIAALAQTDGLYRTGEHLADAERRVRPGDDPRGFVEAHVRRLEALRRAGIVERVEAGVWRVPPDFLDRAAAHEASKGSGVSVTVRSHLRLEEQVRATGSTWLDRNLLGGEPAPAASGFGAEVRSALAARQEVLVEDGLATRRAHRVVLATNLLSTLRDREVSKAAQVISAETGLEHRPLKDGDSVSGIYRRSVQLASGRFAMVGDGFGFSLVPWKPVIEPRLGQGVAGVVRGASVSWDLARQRGIGV